MTREEIIGMGERELYERVLKFVYPDQPDIAATRAFVKRQDLEWALYYCYQAEEKIINELGKGEEWADNLSEITESLFLIPSDHPGYQWQLTGRDKFAHAYPIQRAQAILLTVEGNHE